MNLVLGQPLGQTDLFLKRKSRQTLAVDWFNDTALTDPSDLTGVTMTILLGDRESPLRTWNASNAGNRSTWTLDESDTDLELNKYSGVMTMDDGAGEVLLFRVVAVVED